MSYLIDHVDDLVALLSALYALICAYVALTPSREDDKLLMRLMQRASFLAPKGHPRKLSMPGKMPQRDVGIDPMLGVLVLLVPLVGCGASGLDVARATASTSARGIVDADPILVAAYDRATEAFESGELEEAAFDARLAKLDRAERALRSLSSSLTAVDLALGAYEDGHECGLRPALDGAAAAAEAVVEAFAAAGLDVPAYVTQAVGIASVVLDAPVCDPSAAVAS